LLPLKLSTLNATLIDIVLFYDIGSKL